MGGELYEDQILIQADLIIDDADTLQPRDNEELVSELVAFVDHTPSETIPDDAPQVAMADANGDLLGQHADVNAFTTFPSGYSPATERNMARRK